MRLVAIGVPRSRRSALLADAAGRWRGLDLVEVSWLDLATGRADLRGIVAKGDVVRFDSAGRDFATEVALLRLGSVAASADGANPSQAELSDLVFERGRILWPAAWYAGFASVLRRVAAQLAECPSIRVSGDVEQILLAFDKTRTLQHLSAHGVTVPPAIGRVGSFDELVDRARTLGWTQCFAKLAFGSSASGAVALRLGRDRMEAYTTTEVDAQAGTIKLFNTRAVRHLTSVSEIRHLIDELCRHTMHAERWLPKAGFDGKRFDLRVLSVAGDPKHVVARLSNTPMTNLHLLNQRGDLDRLRSRCGESSWSAMLETARQAARSFSLCHCLGLDVMVDATLRRHVVLEVNAFGDLLPGVLFDQLNTYETQLESLFGPPPTTGPGQEAA
jgi:hypothetical protein